MLEIGLTSEGESGRANSQREGATAGREAAGLGAEQLRTRLVNLGLTEMTESLDNRGAPPQAALQMLHYGH
eukprot:3204760-Karenia_brevis.AAC.1